MNQDDYLSQRLDDQIDWYGAKSEGNQRWFRRLRVIEIAGAVSIPVLVAYADNFQAVQVVVGSIGAVIAVIAGLLSLYRLQENWIEYRVTAESLKHEKYLFLTRTKPYDVDEPFPLLVEQVENLISKEHRGWAGYVRGKIKTEDHG